MAPRSAQRLFPLAALFLLTATPAFARCEHSAERDATVDAAGASVIEIAARAGDLVIRGRGNDTVDVRGTACASSPGLLEDIRVVAERRGDLVVVEVEIPDAEWSWRDRYASLDLSIDVPDGVLLAVRDSSGDIEIRNVAGGTVHDSSGDLEIHQVAGDLELHDSSGDIDVRGARGEVRVRDSSGDIDVRDSGSLLVVADSSGEIDARDIAGHVLVKRDSSGGITAVRVAGDFTVESDGSGGIEYRDVGGRVSVPSDD